MNAHALQPDLGLVLAHARLYERLAESALDRRRANDRPGFGDRAIQLIARLRSAITQPAPTATGTLPTLTDYPYAR
ncbi:MAG TPA: hypothetical protein VFR14_13945 [Candidatus Limnocylindrales bacterium]|nr:hypothetical protein [Candidatus Limnocylindrales bacterium]